MPRFSNSWPGQPSKYLDALPQLFTYLHRPLRGYQRLLPHPQHAVPVGKVIGAPYAFLQVTILAQTGQQDLVHPDREFAQANSLFRHAPI